MVGTVLLEEVVIDADPRWDPLWLMRWPSGVPIEGTDRVRITLAAGSTPAREIAWVLTDPSLFTTDPAEQGAWRPPPQPAGMAGVLRMHWGSTNRWWERRFPAEPARSEPNADDPAPLDSFGRPIRGVYEAWRQRVAWRKRGARSALADRSGIR